jgi:AraC family transcriptional regulator of adaptative response/methylated-DNA-[protein]-cysteine methyltransferase
VRFFSGGKEAQAAGFRPCRRCRPEEAAQPTLAQRAAEWIQAHLDEPLTLEQLGAAVGASPAHLQRSFKRELGLSPRQYAEALRFERAKEGLRSGDDVTTAIYDAGYGSSSRFYERAGARLGMTPDTYRRGGAGMTIRYTIVDSPFGRLLAGTTERGLCAVSLAEDDATLEGFLRAEYPAAEVIRDDETLQPTVTALLDRLDGRSPAPELPLDLAGTDFQRRVWEVLRTIPYGETRSYAQIASALDQPQAVRAVAQACGSNRVALVIPCHRVVRSDGSPGGYRWGVERKQAILERERLSRVG